MLPARLPVKVPATAARQPLNDRRRCSQIKARWQCAGSSDKSTGKLLLLAIYDDRAGHRAIATVPLPGMATMISRQINNSSDNVTVGGSCTDHTG